MSNFDFIPAPARAKDLTGQVFGKLTVLGAVRLDGSTRRIHWVSQCDCGNIVKKPHRAPDLVKGHATSCGCYVKSLYKTMARKHGGCYSSEYVSWKAMWDRTTNERHKSYQAYKSRTPSPEFRDFAVWLKEIGPSPGKGFTVERINNELGYLKGNIRWATHHEQAQNQVSNVKFTCQRTGDVLTMAEACRRSKLNYSTVRSRRTRQGLTTEQATNGMYK